MARVRSQALRFRPCLLGALLASGVHSGQAQTTPKTFSLEYTAPAICPDKAHFVQAIVDRAPQAREASAESAQFRFVAQLEASASGGLARGSVSVEQQDRSVSRRDVAEAPCSDVVESMAVILSLILAGSESAPAAPPVAVAVIPSASAPTAPAPEPPAEQAPVPAVEQPPPPAVPPKEPVSATEREPSATPLAVEEAPAGPSTSERLRFGIRLAGVAETGVAPSVAFGGQGGLDLWWARSGFWSPSARLTARYVSSGVEVTDSGSARFRLVAMRAELCPARWPERSSTFGRVCGLFDAGQLEAQPQSDVPGDPQSQTMPWIGGGGSLRLESTLADTVSLEAAADLLGTTRADTFTIDPGSHEVHEVPRISAMFSLGAVVRLP